MNLAVYFMKPLLYNESTFTIINEGNKMTVKYYSKRDSATAVLRKLGLHKDFYNQFIEQLSPTSFALNLTKAEDFLAKLTNDESEPEVEEVEVKEVEVESVKEVVVKKERKPRDRSVSRRCRELILEGKTDDEVWEVIKVELDLDDTKSHYPRWNRNQMKRSGLI